jgi:hypothetical protein
LAGADGKEEEEKNRVCRGLSGGVRSGATTSVIERRFTCWPLAAGSIRQTLLAKKSRKIECCSKESEELVIASNSCQNLWDGDGVIGLVVRYIAGELNEILDIHWTAKVERNRAGASSDRFTILLLRVYDPIYPSFNAQLPLDGRAKHEFVRPTPGELGRLAALVSERREAW